MSRDIDIDLLDYYRHYCELTIWFKKIILHANPNQFIAIKDVTAELIDERNRILNYVSNDRKKKIRRKLNIIASSYYDKIANWSKLQKSTVDMV